MNKAAFLLVFILACNLVAAQHYFIKFDGIDGESKNQYHLNWSEIESFDQDLGTNPSTIVTTRTRRTSSLGNTISIVKKIDKSSPKIMEALIRGNRIPKVEIEFSNFSNNRNDVIYRYELEKVTVTNYTVIVKESDLPTEGELNFPMEEITISFEKQKVLYTEYDRTGHPRGTIETVYEPVRRP